MRPLVLFTVLLLYAVSSCGGTPVTPADASADGAAVDGPAADAPVTCSYGGSNHLPGSTFPSGDGCNTCTCVGGAVACSTRACPPSDAAPDVAAACDFTASYSYGPIGGNRLYTSRSELGPGRQFRHTRTPTGRIGGPVLTCSPRVPDCGASGVITARDIEVDGVGRADVQAALAAATPPFFGHDSRPVDGTAFELKRADGRGFVVGDPCDGRAGCVPIPPGIAQLAKRLQDLEAQQLAAPECAQLQDGRPMACHWPASLDVGDGGAGRCRAKRYSLRCDGGDAGVQALCLSDLPDRCDGPGTVPGVTFTCQNQCAAGEYAVVCGGIGPGGPSVEPPSPACRAPSPTPGGTVSYCCPCDP